mmetsp:Transcript_48378/g.59523  ORF Transcript_48378/g.59523 Transcript_48378/m.59523 type:complete len:126 (-) Transcript_48378:174-551(-)
MPGKGRTKGNGSDEEKSRVGRKKGEQKKRSYETYNIYIYKVLKQVHPKLGISKKGMNIMNGMVFDIFDRVVNEAALLVKYNKKLTLDPRAIQCAIKLVLPGELAKHAEGEANKAVKKFLNAIKKD